MIWNSIKEPFWEDRPAIIVGAGRSLQGFDLSQLRGLGRIIAVNGALGDLPFADMFFSLDLVWPKLDGPKKLIESFQGEVVLAIPVDQPEKNQPIAGATYIKRRRRCDGLSDDPSEIEASGTSGHGALNCAYLKKAKTIFLFGFDYDGGGHYCQASQYGHERDPKMNDRYWEPWGKNFSNDLPQLSEKGIRVINASPHSRIDAFPKCTPLEALEMLKELK